MIGAWVIGWAVGAICATSVTLLADHAHQHSGWNALAIPAIVTGAAFLLALGVLVAADLKADT